MATGSVSDIVSRLQKWLPSRWFPTQAQNADGSVPRIYAQLVSWAVTLSQVWNQAAYAKAQTRLPTSSDGWVDLSSQDYFGGNLPRLPGETDAAFLSRIAANLFLPANTRSAILSAVEQVTGNPARITEPFQPNDNLVWGRGFWGYDRTASPGQWSNGSARCAVLIECALPLGTQGTGTARFGWGNGFWGSVAQANGWWWTNSAPGESGQQLVYAALGRVRSVGITAYVKFVPAASLP